ncbi:protein of unknown function [Vibrio tapetis subsp. tapetis]|uniref:Uncharacterized protein n=1 Tax=Vibrio tapetis subsp. tapetis TaxID=1671868 RepID=A0A2N8ZND5_9VIBR|nr:protein of unknown function [Vibrio tapetis subsp. tapetis]
MLNDIDNTTATSTGQISWHTKYTKAVSEPMSRPTKPQYLYDSFLRSSLYGTEAEIGIRVNIATDNRKTCHSLVSLSIIALEFSVT